MTTAATTTTATMMRIVFRRVFFGSAETCAFSFMGKSIAPFDGSSPQSRRHTVPIIPYFPEQCNSLPGFSVVFRGKFCVVQVKTRKRRPASAVPCRRGGTMARVRRCFFKDALQKEPQRRVSSDFRQKFSKKLLQNHFIYAILYPRSNSCDFVHFTTLVEHAIWRVCSTFVE